MQVFERDSHILVIDQALSARLEDHPLTNACLFSNTDICLFDVAAHLVEMETLSSVHSADVTPRYMDRFYFAFGDNSDARQELLTAFFDLIADQYNQLINKERNADNICRLLKSIEELSGTLSGLRILDFGCGVGLSHDIARAMSCDLIGFDICPNMRAAAESRGMVVWGPHELTAQPHRSLDAIFASYVFHLRPSTGSIRLAWSRLRTGGLLVANLHKNKGSDVLFPCMKELGAKELTVGSSEAHGKYVAFAKGG